MEVHVHGEWGGVGGGGWKKRVRESEREGGGRERMI